MDECCRVVLPQQSQAPVLRMHAAFRAFAQALEDAGNLLGQAFVVSSQNAEVQLWRHFILQHLTKTESRNILPCKWKYENKKIKVVVVPSMWSSW